MPTLRSSSWPALAGWLVLVYAVAAIGAAASVDAADFYARLDKPAWAPPAGWFGPVWTVLYALMGVAAWLALRRPSSNRVALVLFLAQLAANALWSWLFFGWRLGAAAAFEVLLLFALIAATAWAFRTRSRLAAALLLAYLLWVGFASALTWSVWQRNPSLLG
jgi:tryptophan-rich sensory protein